MRIRAYIAPVSSSRSRDLARTSALALVVFVLAHNLIFLATYGGDAAHALEATGHGSQWTATVALVIALALVLAVAGAVRLGQLSRLARRVDQGGLTVERADDRSFAVDLVRRWCWILLAALACFVISENIEHISVGLSAPGLAVLGSAAYDATLPIFAAVAFVAALIDALYRWRHDVLLARIVAAGARWARAAGSVVRPPLPWTDPRHAAIAGHRIAGRAPPLLEH
jgi:hypothetical protein